MPAIVAQRWILVAAAVLGACASSSSAGPPSSPGRASEPQEPALTEAIARWHDDGEIGGLVAYIAAHPDDDLGVWREVVALHRYDESYGAGDGPADVDVLRSIARQYPGTIGGNIAAVTVFGDGLGRLHAEVPGPLVIDFLDGGDAWARDASGSTTVGHADLVRAREQYAPALREKLGTALATEGCNATMGYCSWWLARQPDAAATPVIAKAVADTWSRRAHPTWKGGEHARCSLKCVKRCKPLAAPLDDSCFAPCYSRC